ncbi:MAG: RimK family alpha-L-glutamate ligase [Candidatus Berkelbacteria bacterium]|nr:RimK family alpha-L-glutamate ligase [Candidatus Berkelbacteria bacterium]
MKIAILGCERSWSIKKIEKTAIKRGHKVTFIRDKDLVVKIDPKLEVSINGITDLKNFDVLLRRRIVNGYLQSLIAARYMRRHGKLAIPTRIDVGQALDDKMTQAVKLHSAGIRHLPVFQALTRKNAVRLLRMVDYPIIIKGIIGTKGRQVFKINTRSAALKIIKKYKYANVLIQEFVNIKHDRRVFVVGKKVLGVMKRIIPEGEYRANIAQGAKAKKAELSKELKRIALKAARTLDYDIAGVDVIYRKGKPAVLEVNSSPGLKGFSKATGINVAGEIVIYLEERFRIHQRRLKKQNHLKHKKAKREKEKKGWWQKNISQIFGSKN